MKTGRRDFLVTASLATVCMRGSWSATLPSEHAASGHALTIVFDEHLADSHAFAIRARAMGARIVPLGNDIGMLWLKRLMPLATSPGNTIAGLTTHANAFLLTRFAQGIGLQVAQGISETHVASGTLVMWQLDADGARTSS
ncbi:hypothetical protein LJR029_001948 [Caballeronia sp. LjRoot29]|jgi:hypothetical protein|uniref:hypothetical protein n=1 Tax=Caballeronia sp. LjRoot29 TaxID=3342315 RepID=UPI003ECF88D7